MSRRLAGDGFRCKKCVLPPENGLRTVGVLVGAQETSSAGRGHRERDVSRRVSGCGGKSGKRGHVKKSSAKHTLTRPDLHQARSAVLNSLLSKESQRGYRHAIDEFIESCAGHDQRQACGLRRLAYEAADADLLRLGNWPTIDQARALWQVPDPNTRKGKRDRALLGLLVDMAGQARHVRTVPVHRSCPRDKGTETRETAFMASMTNGIVRS